MELATAPLKVTFDTNVWQKVVEPNEYLTDPQYASYTIIHEAIVNRRILPFLSETIFSIEGIQRKNRLSFLRKDTPNIQIEQTELEDGTLQASIILKPNPHLHPGNNPIADRYLQKARELNFTIIPIHRIGGITNPDIQDLVYKLNGEEFDRIAAVCIAIEDHQAGVYHAIQLGSKYKPQYWYNGLGMAPESENKKVAAALAEWSDGDSVAAHIGMNNQYFCTNDLAKGAGNRSILSEENLKWLAVEYNFKTISPEKLAVNIQTL